MDTHDSPLDSTAGVNHEETAILTTTESSLEVTEDLDNVIEMSTIVAVSDEENENVMLDNRLNIEKSEQMMHFDKENDPKNLIPTTPKGSNKTLLRLPASAGKSLRRITESFTEFICASQETEDATTSPSLTLDQGWIGGRCLCCGQCYPCLHNCTGSELNDFDNNSVISDIEHIRQRFEHDIDLLMSLPADRGNMWRDSVCTWLSGEGYEFEPKVITTNNSQELRSMLYRNRSHIVNAQARKIKLLRNKMHFRDSNLGLSTCYSTVDKLAASKPSRHSTLRQVNSMDESHHSSRKSEVKIPKSDNVISISAFMTAALGEMNQNDKNEPIKEEEELFYDSDPETYNETRLELTNSDKFIPVPPLMQLPEEPLWTPSTNDDESDDSSEEGSSGLTNIYDSELVSYLIHELTSGMATLVWHPSRSQKSKEVSPVCVQAWFEMGSRLKDRVIQPKFMWRGAYEPDLHKKEIAASTATPHDVELLNVVRVLKPHSIDREEYPFAKLKNSFTIHSNIDEIYLFECTSHQERDKFVHGMKLIVARLASKIIVGDENVFDEFFTPWGQLGSGSHLNDDEYAVPYSESNNSSFSLERHDSTASVDLNINSQEDESPTKLHRALPVMSGEFQST